MDEPAAIAPPVQAPEPVVPIPAAPAATVLETWPPTAEVRKTLAQEPEQVYQAPPAPLADLVPEWQPVEPGPEAELTAPPEPPMQAPQQERSAPSKARLALLIGIPAAVLLAAGGGWAWYAHTHLCGSCGTTSPVTPQPPIAQTSAPSEPSGAQPSKPPAGTAASGGAGASHASTIPAPKPIPAPLPPPPAQNSGNGGHGNPAAPTPAFLPTPAPKPIQNVQGRSGVEHYQGPPVPYGGQVVFHNLPKARLKFTFDSTAWRLTLKPNPDGTKNVTLTSTQQGTQTNCDLGWQVIE